MPPVFDIRKDVFIPYIKYFSRIHTVVKYISEMSMQRLLETIAGAH